MVFEESRMPVKPRKSGSEMKTAASDFHIFQTPGMDLRADLRIPGLSPPQ